MFEHYAESARNSLFFAHEEVNALGDSAMEPHHLLLGIVDEGSRAEFLISHGITFAATRDWCERFRRPNGGPSLAEVPFARETVLALTAALRESRDLQATYVESEHLLLGLLALSHSPVAEFFEQRGVDVAAVRNAATATTSFQLRRARLPFFRSDLIESLAIELAHTNPEDAKSQSLLNRIVRVLRMAS